jgi:hypothetical protein
MEAPRYEKVESTCEGAALSNALFEEAEEGDMTIDHASIESVREKNVNPPQEIRPCPNCLHYLLEEEAAARVVGL